MQDWTGGYVTEVEYISGFYQYVAPCSMAYSGLMRNLATADPYASYNWLEVGCGTGLCANALAAANPQSRFYAFDFNPVHILAAQRYAAQANVDNVTFIEASFEEMLGHELPQMDYIVMHGIFSWVTEEHRAQIAALVRKFLKPGGLVYVSYNALPGWSGKEPLRRLIAERARRQPGPATQRFDDASAFAAKMAAAKMRYFDAQPAAKSQLDHFATQEKRYLVHEYLNEAWRPMYSDEVAALLAECKLTFAASATLQDNIDGVTLPAEARELVRSEPDSTMRELLRDYAMNTPFRRDLFVRGFMRVDRVELLAQAARWRFGLAQPRGQCKLVIKVPVGEMTLPEAVYGPLLDALQAGPRSLDELARMADMALAPCIEAIGLFYSLGYVQPYREPTPEAIASCAAFNRAALLKTITGDVQAVLVAPSLGSAIGIGRLLQYMMYAYLQNAGDLAAFVLDVLEQQGQAMLEEGKPLSKAEKLDKLREREAYFRNELLPLYRTWGVLT